MTSSRRQKTRRLYETTAFAAVRKNRQIVLFWARRGRKSTTLGAIAYDEMSRERGRTVIAASASLLLGTELVGVTLSATEQAAMVLSEASALRNGFLMAAASRKGETKVQCANRETGRVYGNLSDQGFAELYQSSKLELRLHFDNHSLGFSRLRIIAPNPATARDWGGTVLRDEAAYTPAALEKELRLATKPIIDTDPSFKIINYKTWLGDLYCAAINENKTALPSDAYLKCDHRLPIKNRGRYECEPDQEGRHGDTFDSGKLAEYALEAGVNTVPMWARGFPRNNPGWKIRARRAREIREFDGL